MNRNANPNLDVRSAIRFSAYEQGSRRSTIRSNPAPDVVMPPIGPMATSPRARLWGHGQAVGDVLQHIAIIVSAGREVDGVLTGWKRSQQQVVALLNGRVDPSRGAEHVVRW